MLFLDEESSEKSIFFLIDFKLVVVFVIELEIYHLA